jgi:hypothetical protein
MATTTPDYYEDITKMMDKEYGTRYNTTEVEVDFTDSGAQLCDHNGNYTNMMVEMYWFVDDNIGVALDTEWDFILFERDVLNQNSDRHYFELCCDTAVDSSFSMKKIKDTIVFFKQLIKMGNRITMTRGRVER